MTFREQVKWAMKSRRIGWYATRQGMLKRGATMHDVAWVLVSVLRIQGAE